MDKGADDEENGKEGADKKEEDENTAEEDVDKALALAAEADPVGAAKRACTKDEKICLTEVERSSEDMLEALGKQRDFIMQHDPVVDLRLTEFWLDMLLALETRALVSATISKGVEKELEKTNESKLPKLCAHVSQLCDSSLHLLTTSISAIYNYHQGMKAF